MKNAKPLRVSLGPLELDNPVMPGSGTFGREMVPYVDPGKLGAIVTRSVTLHPHQGPPPPRLVETASGLLSAVGVQSEGLEWFMREELPFWRRFRVPLVISVAGESPEELESLVGILGEKGGVAALEINLASFPQLSETLLISLFRDLRNRTKLPLIGKLSPFYEPVWQARSCQEGGADALALVYGLPGLYLDIKTGIPKIGAGWGAVSGPAIKPVALGTVWKVRQSVALPIIGMGGIFTSQDAAEFLMAGANAVAVGTATLVNPKALLEILSGLEAFFLREGYQSVEEIFRKGKHSLLRHGKVALG